MQNRNSRALHDDGSPNDALVVQDPMKEVQQGVRVSKPARKIEMRNHPPLTTSVAALGIAGRVL